MKRVYFKGKEYVFTGDRAGDGGSIATEEQYVNGQVSFAYLHPTGEIIRFHEVIGHVEDLVFGEDIDLTPASGALDHVLDQMGELLMEPFWPEPFEEGVTVSEDGCSAVTRSKLTLAELQERYPNICLMQISPNPGPAKGYVEYLEDYLAGRA